MSRLPIIDAPEDAVPLEARGAVRRPGWLADRQGRSLKYLRLSVTDRCDLRCTYCMPDVGVPASPREDVLTFEEIVRVAKVFATLGVKTIRLTGGEPLVRRNLFDLVRMIREEAGIEDIALTTNATALAPVAKALVAAGLTRINVSLDSVDPDRFARMTRGGDVTRVIRGIEAVLDAGIVETKTNAVVVRGENDDVLAENVQWAWERGITPRFIELMPLGEGARLGTRAVVAVEEMKRSLAHLLVENEPTYRADRGPAGYVQGRDGVGRVGFIGAVTDNFCDRCNRVRVTARGEIRACLASPTGLSLRALVRDGRSNEDVADAVRASLFGKDEGHAFNVEGAKKHHDVDMSRIGG